MRKALLPVLAALLLAGAGAAALLMPSARAQTSPRKPVMIALTDRAAADHDTPVLPPRRAMAEDGPTRRAERCRQLYARAAGRMAYLEASLDLSAASQPLFENWKQARLAVAKRRADDCAHREPPRRTVARLDPAEIMARQENRLKQHIADIEAERPALEALYKALTPAQKQIFARAALPPGAGFLHRRLMFAARMPPMPMEPRRPMGPPPEAPPAP